VQAQPTEAQIDVAKRLETAIRQRNPELVESAVSATFPTPHPIQAPALILLAEASWHQRHEDVVLALQDLRCPDAVGALERTTFSVYEYLAYDEHSGLARKCTWALADIGTPEAHQALSRIATCNNPTIAGYARKRLDNWQTELPRKGVKLS
jgi:HEAT repeat protein